MDKYEYKLCADEIRNLIAERKYKEAVEVADRVDWRNVKSSNMLCTVSDLYKKCRRYEDARDVLLLAYQRNPGGKLIIYSLCELSIKLDDVVNASEFFKEYLQVAPKDTGRYILHYKILEAQGKALEERISILEELQKRECKEKWMYELAYLYHRVGLNTQCVEQCNQVVIFFGEGNYVIKALELKSLHEPLDAEQQALYDRLTAPEEEEIIIPEMNYNTIDIQKELAGSVLDIMGLSESDTSEASPTQEEPAGEEEIHEESHVETTDSEAISEEATQVIPKIPEETDNAATQVIPVEEVNEKAEEAIQENTDDDTKIVSTEEIEEIKAATEPEAVEEKDETPDKPAPTDSDVVEYTPDTVFDKKDDSNQEENSDIAGQISMFDDPVSLSDTIIFSRKEVEEALGGSVVETEYKESPSSVNFDEMLKLEGDGQISLVVPEQLTIEKQITGQICIDEVLLDYERMRQENEKKWTDDVSAGVKGKYAEILKDFEETKDDGLLKDIEESLENNEFAAELPEESIPEEEVVVVEEDNPEEPADEKAADEEPTAEELTFDRTPFVSPGQEEDKEIEEPSDGGEPYAVSSNLDDYLNAFAEAGEIRDKEEQEALDILNRLESEGEDTEDNESETEIESETEPEEQEEAATENEAVPEENSENKDAEEKTEAPDETTGDEESEQSSEEVKDTNTETETEEESDFPEHDGFTDEQWARLESFILTEKPREQIKETIANLSHLANTGNVIISSVDVDSAIELSKALAHEESLKELLSHKVYMIKASSLNAKDVEATFNKVIDQALVIQDAEELRRETLETMKRVMSDPERTMLVFLTVSHRQKARFIKENEDLLEYFNLQVDIEALDNAELVKLATKYAFKREFAIDEMGTLALHTRIDERQTNSHSVLFSEVREIVDEAINHASRKSLSNVLGRFFKKRYDENDMIILGEKDFTE